MCVYRRVLQLSELSRKMETLQEQVLPFVYSSDQAGDNSSGTASSSLKNTTATTGNINF